MLNDCNSKKLVDRAGVNNSSVSNNIAVTTLPQIGETSGEHPDNLANLLAELNRTKVRFQLRTLCAVLGVK